MIVIIMAGGMGKRMESDLPKVLHKVTDPTDHLVQLPMLIHVINTAIKLNPKKIFIIVGKFRKIITETINWYIQEKLTIFSNIIEYIDQETPMGTAHAIKCCLNYIAPYSNSRAIILSGDVPLISTQTLSDLCLINTNTNTNINKLLVTELENPFGCGRILLNEYGNIYGIREEKDCNDNEKQIKLVNCGIYQINVNDLINLIPQINNNNKSQEYYLTDIIDLMITNNIPIDILTLKKSSQWEIKNVNTKKDLEELNNFVCTNLQC